MSEPALERILEVAMEAAHAAGRRTLGWFGRSPIESKGDGTPVTPADRESEATLRRIILGAFPNHGILGEETGETPGTEPFRWIVDPLDGTRSFVHGVPLFGVLVGVEWRTEPVVGVIYHPALDEMIAAAKDMGCAWNGRTCRVSETSHVGDALLCATSTRQARRRGRGYDTLSQAVKMERTWGDCYGYGLVATGRADVMLDDRAAVWDIAAILPIIEEAGGRLTDWSGRRTVRGGEAIASNGLLHDSVVGVLGG